MSNLVPPDPLLKMRYKNLVATGANALYCLKQGEPKMELPIHLQA